MLFIVIAAVLIAFSYQPPADLAEITPATTSSAGVLIALFSNWIVAALIARLALRRLDGTVDERVAALRSYQRMRWMLMAVVLGSYVALVHALDWPGVVRRTWNLERWILIDDVLVLAPFVASLLVTWLAHFDVEQKLRSAANVPDATPWSSRWSHIDFHVRHHIGIVLAPLLGLVAIQDTLAVVFADSPRRAIVEVCGGVFGLCAVLLFAPLFLRMLWRARPLPPGPLRQRLEQLSRRLRFRASDILIWQTRGAVVNAAVAGILPWPRYVLLSDGLLDHLDDDEVAAVFGHEVGHIRHHHLWFFIAFLQGASLFFLLTTSAVSQFVTRVFGNAAVHSLVLDTPGMVLPLGCFALYFGVFFGFLSRRFERQADVFGCRAVSCGRRDCPPNHELGAALAADVPLCPTGIQVFVRALEKISLLNGSVRETRSWRHFSIAKRVEFLEGLAVRPESERSFQRMVLLLKALVVTGLAAGAWYVWWSPDQFIAVLGG